MSKIYTAEELSTHNKPDNLWLAVDGDVYDLTTFQEEHPGKVGSSGVCCRRYLRLGSFADHHWSAGVRWQEE